MKRHKCIIGGLLSGLVIISSVQLFGAYNGVKHYKKDRVYSAQNEVKSAEDKKLYQAKCLDILKNYLQIDTSKIAQKVDFSIDLIDREEEVKVNNVDITMAKEALDAKQITKQEYDDRVAAVEQANQKAFDKIRCTLEIKDASEGIEGTYILLLDDSTKELYSLRAPLSEEATMMMVDGSKTKLSLDSLKEEYMKLVEQNKVAGIEKPVCSEVNNEEIPSFIFIDQKDASKKVEVDLDPATGKLYSLFVQ